MPHTPHLDTYDRWVAKLALTGFIGHEAEVCAELLAIRDTDGHLNTPGHLEYLRGFKKQLALSGVKL